MMDPAVISFECSETSQVPLHRTDHARDACDGLKEDDSVEPSPLIITCLCIKALQYDLVKAESTKLYRLLGGVITNALGWLTSDFNFIKSFHRVDGVCHSVALWIHYHFVLG